MPHSGSSHPRPRSSRSVPDRPSTCISPRSQPSGMSASQPPTMPFEMPRSQPSQSPSSSRTPSASLEGSASISATAAGTESPIQNRDDNLIGASFVPSTVPLSTERPIIHVLPGSTSV